MHADDSEAQDATSMTTSAYADVLLVSQATGNISDFAEISTRINAAYARRHGYGYSERERGADALGARCLAGHS